MAFKIKLIKDYEDEKFDLNKGDIISNNMVSSKFITKLINEGYAEVPSL